MVTIDIDTTLPGRRDAQGGYDGCGSAYDRRSTAAPSTRQCVWVCLLQVRCGVLADFLLAARTPCLQRLGALLACSAYHHFACLRQRALACRSAGKSLCTFILRSGSSRGICCLFSKGLLKHPVDDLQRLYLSTMV